MKMIIPIALSLMVGCTTGSKTKTNINYYSNVSYAPPTQPEYIYQEVVVEKPIYYGSRNATMTDLGSQIGYKMLRKMKAAYNEN